VLPLLHETLVQDRKPAEQEYLRKYCLSRLGLEQLLESISVVVGTEALDILNTCASRPGGEPLAPNDHHRLIAQLAHDRSLPHIITLNFDTFIEQALNTFGVPHLVPEADANEADAYDDALSAIHEGRDDIVRLYKLHGTIAYRPSIITTMETLGTGLPRHKADLLALLLANKDLLIVGYSDNDVDVFAHLEATPPTGHIYWHAHSPLQADRRDQQRILDFLQDRPNTILYGRLTDILAASHATTTVSPTTTPKLSSDDLQNLYKRRNRELQELLSRQYLPWLSPDLAALILGELVGTTGRARRQLRERLWNGITPEHLHTDARRRFDAQRAQRATVRGDARVAFAIRTQLIQELRAAHREGATGASPEVTNLLLEQGIRRAQDAARIARLRPTPLKLLQYWNARRVATRLSRQSTTALAKNETERLAKMTAMRKPDFWRDRVLKVVLLALENRLDGRTSPRHTQGFERRLRRYAERAVRGYQEILATSSGAGWNGHALLQLAETLMHRDHTVTDEVESLLTRARWRTRPAWTADFKPMQARELGPHEGLRHLYRGENAAATTVLRRTLIVYRGRGDPSGASKTLLYLAMAYEQAGNRAEALRALSQRQALLRQLRDATRHRRRAQPRDIVQA